MSNWVKGIHIFTEDGVFRYGDVCYADRIEKLIKRDDGIAGPKRYLIPGLVDIHTHGAVGYDASDGAREALFHMSDYYARNGITAFCATTMAFPEEKLIRVMETAAVPENLPGARCIGVNLEGPFLNEQVKGAQAGEYIVAPDDAMMERLHHAASGNIRIICIAPEIEGAAEFIKKWRGRCVISLAHTMATYEQAMDAFELGCDHVTHLFNAMSPFLSREPGVPGAAADSGAYVELICDGVHLHPAVIRSAFRMFGEDRVCLISDSMRCTGLPDGTYELGGQDVFVKSGVATLADGTLAGSSIDMMTALRNVVRFGIPLEHAVAAATRTPARSVGYEEGGSIAEGNHADFVLLDEEFQILDVIVGGRSMTMGDGA